MAANRLQRWAIILSGYNYNIKYVESSKNGVDGLSRIPSEFSAADSQKVSYLNFIEENIPHLSIQKIRSQTHNDPTLSKVKHYVLNGWPKINMNEELYAYFVRRNELTIEQNCIMWGYRIIIPLKLRDMLLREVHSIHLGIVKAKMLARSFFWWPKLDQELEGMIES
ncbi:hypothetical protein Trydic_g2177 [Trypoxylus dichotomus]